MKKLQHFGKLVEEFSDVADFFVVYIEEAHPKGGWEFNVSTLSVTSRYEGREDSFLARKIYENDLTST